MPATVAMGTLLIALALTANAAAAPKERATPAAVRGRTSATAAAAPTPVRALVRSGFDARTGLAEPSITALVAATTRGDRNETARLAERIGIARFATVLTTNDRAADRPQLLAVLEAVRLIDGGVRLLTPVSRLVSDGDPRTSERAARSVGELLRADRLDKLAEWEVSAEEVYGACAALAKVISGDNATAALRVAALEALSEAHAYCRNGLALESGMTADFAPEVRRAALLAPQIGQTAAPDVIGNLIEDPVPLVAGAAAAVWCRSQYEKLRKRIGEVEQRRLFRIRILLLADVAPPEDTSEILPCLALSKDPDDVSTVDVVRKRLAEATEQK